MTGERAAAKGAWPARPHAHAVSAVARNYAHDDVHLSKAFTPPAARVLQPGELTGTVCLAHALLNGAPVPRMAGATMKVSDAFYLVAIAALLIATMLPGIQ